MRTQENNEPTSDEKIKTEKIRNIRVLKVLDLYPKIESKISIVRTLRRNDYKDGFDFVIENAGQIGVGGLEKLSEPSFENEIYERITNRKITDKIFGCIYYEQDIADIHFIVSNDFVKGMREAAKILLKKSGISSEEMLEDMILKIQLDMP